MCIFVAAAPAAGASAAAGISAATAAALNMALVTAAATAAQMAQASANASMMAEHQQNQADAQEKVSKAAAFSKYAALSDRATEREIALSHALEENRRKALEAKSASRVMAGEGGVQGKSVGLILGDVEKQNQEYQTALLQQVKFEDAQYLREGEAIRSGHYAARIAAAPDPVPTPDYLGGVANVFASAYGTYASIEYS